MNDTMVRRVFVIFYYTLGIVVFLQSLITVWYALGVGGVHPPNIHLILLGGVEAIAAILFMIPATMKIGARVLLAIFAVAIILHGFKGELQSTLFVYAAGVLLVMVLPATLADKKDNK